MLLVLQVFPDWTRQLRVSAVVDAKPAVAAGYPYGRKAIGILDRKLPQRHGVDELEDCGVGADAKSQREHGYSGEARRMQKGAQGIPKISSDAAHRWGPFRRGLMRQYQPACRRKDADSQARVGEGARSWDCGSRLRTHAFSTNA